MKSNFKKFWQDVFTLTFQSIFFYTFKVINHMIKNFWFNCEAKRDVKSVSVRKNMFL